MKKRLSGLDKTLIFVAIIVVLFTISMIVTYWFFQDIPNVLVTAVFGATFAECGFCSYIWKQKISREGSTKTEKEDLNDESGNSQDMYRSCVVDYCSPTDFSNNPLSEEQIRTGENGQASELY